MFKGWVHGSVPALLCMGIAFGGWWWLWFTIALIMSICFGIGGFLTALTKSG